MKPGKVILNTLCIIGTVLFFIGASSGWFEPLWDWLRSTPIMICGSLLLVVLVWAKLRGAI